MSTTPQEQRVQTLAALWSDLLPFDCPEIYRLNLWEMTHGLQTCLYAIREVALKRAKLGGDSMTREQVIRLVGAICASVARAQKHLGNKN